MNIHGSQAVRQRKRLMMGLALIAVCAIGFAGGRFWVYVQNPIMDDPGFRNLSFAYDEIMDDYLEGADSRSLVNGAIEGMVGSLGDPYSVYLTEAKGEQFIQSYEDHFVGIGVTIREQDGEFVIEEAIKDAPAEKAGLKTGDVMLKVDGTPMKGMTLDKLMTLVRGQEGTEVKLQIRREGLAEPLELPVVRGAVPVHTVSFAMKEDGIGTIAINRFADKTGDEFDKAIEALQAKGMKKLLLDLRSNPGGLLEPTIHIANRFVPKGKTIVQVVYKGEKRIITHKSEQKEPWKLPVAILVDGNTASSAEVLTAALKDTAGAVVIGEQTFGKGIVQQFRQLADGSVLKLTEAQWRSPDGQWIHKKGIEPTRVVKAPAYTQLPRLPVGLKLQEGDYGERVETAQQMLQVLGYITGEPPGIYNADTIKAVKAFQLSEGIPANGILNDRTAYRITTRLMEKYRAEDPQMLTAMEELRAAAAEE
ncbi:S41 family peptidase [Paenibacillus mendelii]|uniref:S41 family peptidase n=1 Tax=Paenibacillus mendelii TaxID=206163 RepID=A0ABV6JK07_9BACL|nr:S41 family peptidase [Paenibacillus mendelii]MCQ6559077.1 S41 family peptidase [Paenibacillus mendelii]